MITITTIGIGSLTALAGALPCSSVMQLQPPHVSAYQDAANDSYFPKTTLVKNYDYWVKYEVVTGQGCPVTVFSREIQ